MSFTLSELVSTYLFGVMALVFFVWIFSGIRKRAAQRKELAHWTRCRLCSMEIQIDGKLDEEGLVECPRCQVKNEPRRMSLV